MLNQPEAAVASTSSGLPHEVEIDGVTFVSDARGKKLIRKTLADAAASSDGPAPGTPTRASVSGQTFVRTKSGNLVALSLVQRRDNDIKLRRINGLLDMTRGAHRSDPPAAGPTDRRRSSRGRGAAPGRKTKRSVNKPCRFFTSTGASPAIGAAHEPGQCRSGLTCPYTHDPDKVAACPKWLRNRCPLKASACPLSHVADPRRMPHCTHYPRCNKPAGSCPYPHVHVAPSAPVCADFGRTGWCELGTACPNRHVRECPEFGETGTCKTAGCRLPHIIRRRARSDDEDDEADAAEVEEHRVRPPPASHARPVRHGISLGSGATTVEPAAKRRRTLDSGVADNSDFLSFGEEDDDDDLRPAPIAEDEAEHSDVDSDALVSSDEGDEADVAAALAPAHEEY